MRDRLDWQRRGVITVRDLIIGMAGAGGDGIVSAGESLLSAVAEEGYFAILTKSFGPQIRGGESSCRLRVGVLPVLNPGGALDVAVALNWDDFRRFGSELTVTPATVVIYEKKTGVAPDALPLEGVKPAVVCAAPIEELALQSAGVRQAKNNVVVGLLAGWMRLPVEGLLAGIRKKFAKYPIAEQVYLDFFRSLERCLVVEQSHQGQLHRLIRMWVDVLGDFRALAKSGANPITPGEIVEGIRALTRTSKRRPSTARRKPRFYS